MDAEDLKRLIEAVCRLFPLANDCEITVEGRVADFRRRKDAGLRGRRCKPFFHRCPKLSIPRYRQDVGRIADRTEVLKMLATLTDLDNGAAIIDLIYGLPGQTMAVWEDDLRTLIEETKLDGSDLYQLNVFKGSLLSRAVNKGKLPPPADIPTQAEMFFKGQRDDDRSWFQTPLHVPLGPHSHGAQPLQYLYPLRGPPASPLGCGAGGRLNGHYFFQEGNLKAYYKRVNAGGKTIGHGHSPAYPLPSF